MAGPSQSDFLPPQSSETVTRGQLRKDTRRSSPLDRHQPPPWKEGDRLGSFILRECLGRGSSGCVYRVSEIGGGERTLALKLLLPGSPEDLVRNKCGFRRMQNIQHPGLVRVHRMHRLDDFIGLSMQEVDGVTLYHYVGELLNLPVEQRWQRLLELTRDYASALAAMHHVGLVHRDIKPRNLMVDNQGRGRIVDYGLVGTFDPQEDPNGFRHYYVGSPNYMAPETCWDRYYMPAGDVFSLGLSIVQVARSIESAGRDDENDLPRSDSSRDQDGQLIRGAIQSMGTSIPQLLRDACAEMLELDPAERPSALMISRLGQPPKVNLMALGHEEFSSRPLECDQIRAWIRCIASGGSGRLHICGDSGMGKSALLDRVLEAFPKYGWIQVFRAKCLPREGQPLQAFDTIVDEIVGRFMKSDREPIRMDLASTSVLHEAFPVLASMIKPDDTIAPPPHDSQRLNALQAGVRLTQELSSLGPLILIIDDVHRADRDSLNLLDDLQASGLDSFGIITVSRTPDRLQHRAADATIQLEPLNDRTAHQWLCEVNDRWALGLPDDVIRHWVSVCGGCPLDLQMVADELKPGGVLSSPGNLSGDLGIGRMRLWRRRIDQLSTEAQQVLEWICVAGQGVTYRELGQLSGLGEAVDVVISELSHQRLVLDDTQPTASDDNDDEQGSGGGSVRAIHCSVAEGVMATMSGKRKLAVHRQWAELLIARRDADSLAGRIAGHLLDAELPGEAVPYALKAAEDAERRVAMTEAARWRERVLSELSGTELQQQLREVARCFDAADRPADSGRYFQQLADLLDDSPEKTDLEMIALVQFVRSGQLGRFRQRLADLSRCTGLPAPKSAWKSKLAVLYRAVRLSLGGFRFGDLPPQDAAAPSTDRPDDRSLDQRPLDSTLNTPDTEDLRLRCSVELTRPLSMLDNGLATELGLAATEVAYRSGSEAQRLHMAVGSAVFGSYQPGRMRARSRQLLEEIRPRFEACHDEKLWGDFHSAWGYHHLLQCDWASAIGPMQQSAIHYERSGQRCGFELFHTKWGIIWSLLKTGDVEAMRALAYQMRDDANRRNDRFGWLVSTGGLSLAAWLADDDMNGVSEIQKLTRRSIHELGPQWIDAFDWISAITRDSYLGLWDRVAQCDSGPQNRWIRRLAKRFELLSVLKDEFVLRGLFESWKDRRDDDGPSAGQTRLVERKLSRRLAKMGGQSSGYAGLITDLFRGKLAACSQQPDAIDILSNAADQADQLNLLPYRLVAEDWIRFCHHNQKGTALVKHLRDQGVVRPENFSRLFD
ncbi:protein kinase domain-containing protein [Crateriforma conspicua]|uniref:Serine/threonine-protein kinase PrkC n=1 Tax=Crateriforma conspicua TaxID=2527996 RepID=A0A5C6FP20_9PLAN|nr:protein kinase [Crateriforma conspicua]TWU62418.1 Serine/threonine-protein kinase PrkC [Crateriforma conspicua]